MCTSMTVYSALVRESNCQVRPLQREHYNTFHNYQRFRPEDETSPRCSTASLPSLRPDAVHIGDIAWQMALHSTLTEAELQRQPVCNAWLDGTMLLMRSDTSDTSAVALLLAQVDARQAQDGQPVLNSLICNVFPLVACRSDLHIGLQGNPSSP